MRRELETGLTGDVPIVLSQWYDTAKWILEKIDKFPKNQRFIPLEIMHVGTREERGHDPTLHGRDHEPLP
jgi:hypothetical protein